MNPTAKYLRPTVRSATNKEKHDLQFTIQLHITSHGVS